MRVLFDSSVFHKTQVGCLVSPQRGDVDGGFHRPRRGAVGMFQRRWRFPLIPQKGGAAGYRRLNRGVLEEI